MKESVENLQFSDQCSYALLESFNSIEKSFDSYHISVVLKSLKNIRGYFKQKALNYNTENFLKAREESSLSERLPLYNNFDEILGTKVPSALLSCIENLYFSKKLDLLEKIQRKFYLLSNKSHGIQIIDEIFSTNSWDDSARNIFKDKLPELVETSAFKEILIKKKTIKRNILGGLVFRINTLVVDCSTNNLIRIQLRNKMKVN